MPILIVLLVSVFLLSSSVVHAERGWRDNGHRNSHQNHSRHYNNRSHYRNSHNNHSRYAPPPRHDSYRSGRYRHYSHSLPYGFLHLLLGGLHYYYVDGRYYTHEPAGYTVINAPVGAVIPQLPVGYRVVLGGNDRSYYAVGNTYYERVPNGYKVVNYVAPSIWNEESAPAAIAPTNGLFAYPNQGQNEEQQSQDRYQCHRWSVQQSSYDPSQPNAGENPAQRSNYNRAMTACLEARGYTVK